MAKWMPFSSRPGILQVARLLRAAGQQNGVVVIGQGLDRNVHAHVRVGDKGDAFGAHLVQAAVDDVLLHLEAGNAVTQEAADAVGLLIDGDRVAGAAQLLRGGQPRRTAAHDSHALAGVLLGKLGTNPALLPAALDDGALDELDGDGRLIDSPARRRPRTAPGRCGR